MHTGVAGWPLPEAWLIVPMRLLRRRLLYVNVESAFWRLVPGHHAGLIRRLRASLIERLNRFNRKEGMRAFVHRSVTLLCGSLLLAAFVDKGRKAFDECLGLLPVREVAGLWNDFEPAPGIA